MNQDTLKFNDRSNIPLKVIYYYYNDKNNLTLLDNSDLHKVVVRLHFPHYYVKIYIDKNSSSLIPTKFTLCDFVKNFIFKVFTINHQLPIMSPNDIRMVKKIKNEAIKYSMGFFDISRGVMMFPSIQKKQSNHADIVSKILFYNGLRDDFVCDYTFTLHSEIFGNSPDDLELFEKLYNEFRTMSSGDCVSFEKSGDIILKKNNNTQLKRKEPPKQNLLEDDDGKKILPLDILAGEAVKISDKLLSDKEKDKTHSPNKKKKL